MGMAVGGATKVHSTPNVVPMIDIMLVLLIIFMVITPALLAGFNAIPPQGVNLKDHPEDNSDQVLGIDDGGRYYLNKKLIRYEDIPAHRDLPYEKVLDVMDIAAKNGVRVTGMISDQTPGTKSTVAGDVRAPAGIGGTP